MNPDKYHICQACGEVRIYPPRAEHYDYMSATEAEALRDQLTAAIEEAKRQSDPFERWWNNGRGFGSLGPVSREAARIIWNAATYAAVENK